MISDREPQFVAKLIKELNEMLEIKTKLSMAFHPQIDRQMERTNQELEQYQVPFTLGVKVCKMDSEMCGMT